LLLLSEASEGKKFAVFIPTYSRRQDLTAPALDCCKSEEASVVVIVRRFIHRVNIHSGKN